MTHIKFIFLADFSLKILVESMDSPTFFASIQLKVYNFIYTTSIIEIGIKSYCLRSLEFGNLKFPCIIDACLERLRSYKLKTTQADAL